MKEKLEDYWTEKCYDGLNSTQSIPIKMLFCINCGNVCVDRKGKMGKKKCHACGRVHKHYTLKIGVRQG